MMTHAQCVAICASVLLASSEKRTAEAMDACLIVAGMIVGMAESTMMGQRDLSNVSVETAIRMAQRMASKRRGKKKPQRARKR